MMAKILIIDDDPYFVDATRLLLESQGHQVSSASDGTGGYQRVLKELPDLVILDVMMDSVLEGVFVSRKMHACPVTCDIPILMVTSIATTDFAELFPTDEYIHIDGFISKPADPEKLLRKVQRCLAEAVEVRSL
jgi:CheY-like chemotaxis protein